MREVRFRTLGCYPLTGAIESRGDDVPAIIQEMLLTTTSERQGRVIDHDQCGVDGKEEAGRLLLMARVDRSRSLTTSRPTCDAQEHKSLLRFITCGSVDDGKSTLIGRLLYDSKMVFEDQLAALEADSKKVGTQGGDLDFALLVDGLAAEREQGITIDVAYRFFSTEKRKFIVADTPGHEQYTRNMVTGASTADLAVILIDARKGVLTQTRRHSYIVVAARHPHVVVSPSTRWTSWTTRAGRLRRDRATTIASSPRSIGLERRRPAFRCRRFEGDNIIEPQREHALVRGPDAARAPRDASRSSDACERRARSACRCNGSTGPTTISAASPARSPSGTVRPGDRGASRCRPAARATVARIVTCDGDLDAAVAGQSVTLTLADEIDVSRGDVLAARRRAAGGRRPVRGARSSGWTSEPMLPGPAATC